MKRIKIDRKKCIGCLTCTTACKVAHGGRDTRGHGVLKMDYQTNREVMKCDMCLTVKEQTPQCAAKCPMGALTLQEVES